MLDFCLVLTTLLFLPVTHANDRPEVTLGALVGLTGDSARPGNTVLGSIMCAISEINSNDSWPVRYRLIFTDTESQEFTAFNRAMQISGMVMENTVLYNNSTAKTRDGQGRSGFMQAEGAESQTNFGPVRSVKLDLPIVFGSSWSSMTERVNPVLSSYALIQIGSSTTSASLSDRNSYPSFRRLCPSDSLQARAVVELLVQMEWKKVGILFRGDSYGLSLAFSISREANQFEIEVSAVSFDPESERSIISSSQTLKDSGQYVIVLVAFQIEVVQRALEKNKMWQYPYYFVGVDPWFRKDYIQRRGANINLFRGMLGTFLYSRKNDSDASRRLDQLYRDYYADNDYEAVRGFQDPGIWGGYGYDAMTLVNRAVSRFVEDYDDLNELNSSFRMNNESSHFYNDPAKFSRVLSDYLTDPNLEFEGATGKVSLLPNGERRGASFAFGNINNQSEMSILGTITWVDQENYDVQWDSDFRMKFEPPQAWTDRNQEWVYSTPQIDREKDFIDHVAFATVVCLSATGLFIAGSFLVLLQYFQERTIIRASSKIMNQICCAGAMLWFVTAMLFGIDERRAGTKWLNWSCNIRVTMMVLSINLFFGPLILKTYRIYKIFVFVQRTLNDVNLHDWILISWIACVCVFDLCLCIIFLGFLCPLKRDEITGEEDSDINDSFQINQPYWYTCQVNGAEWRKGFYRILMIWFVLSKGAGMLYGVYLGFNVWSIERKTYNEAINVLSALFGATFSCVIAAMFENFLSTSSNRKNKGVVSTRYLSMFVPTTIACIIGLCAIIGPKLHFIYFNEDQPGTTAYIESTVMTAVRRVIQERQKVFEAEINARNRQNSLNHAGAEEARSQVGGHDSNAYRQGVTSASSSPRNSVTLTDCDIPSSRMTSKSVITEKTIRLDSNDTTFVKLPTIADLSRIAQGRTSLETVVNDCLTAADLRTTDQRSHSMLGVSVSLMKSKEHEKMSHRSMSAVNPRMSGKSERNSNGTGRAIAAMATALPVGSMGVRSAGVTSGKVRSSDPNRSPIMSSVTPKAVHVTPASLTDSEETTPVPIGKEEGGIQGELKASPHSAEKYSA